MNVRDCPKVSFNNLRNILLEKAKKLLSKHQGKSELRS